MINLNELELVDEQIEVAEEGSYVDPQEFPPPIPKGEYLLASGEPDFSPSKKASPDGKHYLKANMTHTVAGGDYDGRTLREFSVSAKTFDRKGPNGVTFKASQLADHLRATGDRTTYTTTQQWADATQAATGKFFKAKVDWEARSKEFTKTDKNGRTVAVTVRGEGKFPLVDGKRSPEVEIDSQGNVIPPGSPNSGTGETLRAFNIITFKFPA